MKALPVSARSFSAPSLVAIAGFAAIPLGFETTLL
jgi:hypothetical protein